MNIDNELKALRRYWRESGPMGKVFLGVGFFLSVSSITTISSAIVDWKGFILTAINFYKVYVVDNIASYAHIFSLSYSQDEIHALVLLSVSIGIGMRMLAAGQLVAFDIINERYGSELKPNLWFFRLLGIGGPVAAWIFYGVSDPVIRWWLVILVFITYPVFLIVPKYFSGEEGYLEKGRYSYFATYYLYLASIFMLVAMLAAVNSGLAENPSNSRFEYQDTQTPPNE